MRKRIRTVRPLPGISRRHDAVIDRGLRIGEGEEERREIVVVLVGGRGKKGGQKWDIPTLSC